MNEFIELRQIVSILRKRWPILVLGAVLGALLGYGISRQLSPIYRASITLIVGQPIQAARIDTRDIQIGEQLAATYAEIGERQPVLQRTVEALELNMTWQALRDLVRITPIAGTQLLEVTVEAGSPADARSIADEVARQLMLLTATEALDETAATDPEASTPTSGSETSQFLEERLVSLQIRIENGQRRVESLEEAMAEATAVSEIRNLQNEIDGLESLISGWENNYLQLLNLLENDQVGGQGTNYVSPIGTAQADLNPIRPQITINTLLGGVVGLMLALGAVALYEYADDTIKSTSELGQVLSVTSLGAVSRMRGKRYQEQLISTLHPFSATAETYRIIRSKMMFVLGDRPPGLILVTSATFGEGKSITAANLAISMAQAGLQTLIVDADLRRPVQHKIFGVNGDRGLSNLLLAQEPDIESYLQDTGIDGLRLLPSGRLPHTRFDSDAGEARATFEAGLNPSELLSTTYSEMLLTALAEMEWSLEADGSAAADNLPRTNAVIIDGPPVISMADAAILANQVNGVVLVVDANRTSRLLAREALDVLNQAGATVLGAILNRASPRLGSGDGSGDYFPESRSSRKNGDSAANGNGQWWPVRGKRQPKLERVVTPPPLSGEEGDDY